MRSDFTGDPVMQKPFVAPLFGYPETRDVALAVSARACTDRHRQILTILVRKGPLTIEETAGQMGLPTNRISGRFGANDPGGLAYNGWIERTGLRRRTSSGCPADVWDITSAGREQLRRMMDEPQRKAG